MQAEDGRGFRPPGLRPSSFGFHPRSRLARPLQERELSHDRVVVAGKGRRLSVADNLSSKSGERARPSAGEDPVDTPGHLTILCSPVESKVDIALEAVERARLCRISISCCPIRVDEAAVQECEIRL